MSSAVDLKTKEEKDAELDKRIEALRKKNEALVKRYQEIEEDKKKAEQEGIAVTTPRKPRPHEPEVDRRKTEKENFTVTVDLSKPTGEKRVVNDGKPGTPRGRKTSEERDGHSPHRRTGSGRVGRGGRGGGGVGVGVGGRQERRDREPRTPRDGESGESGGQGRRGGRRGRGGEGGVVGTPGGMDRKSKEWEEKRRQNIEKMNEEMERIAEYERGQRSDGDKPIRNFLDDPRRSGPAPDTDRKEGSRRHVRNWGGLDFDNVKTGAELEREWTSRRPSPKGSMDMTMSMTGRERAEYLRWKKEREQIDEERLARHRNATGQWRREWDAQKTENMFKEDPYVAAESVTSEQGSRRARAHNSRTESWGRASDDNRRPPKVPTFGDFLSQGRTQGPRGERSRGKGRGQKQSYSMHDNRWEGEKEEEQHTLEREKEKDNTKKEEKPKKKEEKPKRPTAQKEKVEEKKVAVEDDDDEWEDASDGGEEEEEEEVSESEHDSRGDEKKDVGKEKTAKSIDPSPTSPKPRSQPALAGSPKEQRTPRPKVHIPPPAASQDSPEGGKPISPFSPLDGHQPVSDWGEEMEMMSPRSSMGGESPLKPPSSEDSPPQKKNQELEVETVSQAATSSEAIDPVKEENPDGHKPVSDWGEEMEMMLPRSSMGGENPLKPPSSEDSPPQKKNQELEVETVSQAATSTEAVDPVKEENPGSTIDVSSTQEQANAQQTVVVSEPESVPADSPAGPPCDRDHPEPSHPAPHAPSVLADSESSMEYEGRTDQEPAAAPSQADSPDLPLSPAVPEVDHSSPEPSGGKDGNMVGTNDGPTDETEFSEQPSSG